MKKEKFKKTSIVVCLIIKKGKKFLLSRQSPDAPRGAGHWRIPGGGIELGEKLEEAVKREAKEELGIEVKFEKLIGYSEYIESPRHGLFLFCRCRIIKGEISPGSDVDKVKWITKENLKKYELRPAMKKPLVYKSILKLL